MRSARVYVSVMGDDKQGDLTVYGLKNAAGFLQAKVAKRIDTRYTPRLSFVLDKGVKHSIEVSRILDQVLPRPALEELATPAESDQASDTPQAAEN